MSNKTEENEWIEINSDGNNIPLGCEAKYNVKNINNGHNFRLRSLATGNFILKMFIAGEASHFKLSVKI